MLGSAGVCTLIALHRVHRQYPLVVAANRDELYARRTSPAQLLLASPPVLGGRDDEKGGTWLGATAGGLFVGLTNQRSAAPPLPSARSRGEVVLGALATDQLDGALAFVDALEAREYSPFNLFLGDAHRLFVAYGRPEARRVERLELEPGIYALPNDKLGSTSFPKIDRAALLAAPLVELDWDELVPRAQAMLADHDVPPEERIPRDHPPWIPDEQAKQLQALCVHTPIYGTRSATLLAADHTGLQHFLYADGPPCQATLIEQIDRLR